MTPSKQRCTMVINVVIEMTCNCGHLPEKSELLNAETFVSLKRIRGRKWAPAHGCEQFKALTQDFSLSLQAGGVVFLMIDGELVRYGH